SCAAATPLTPGTSPGSTGVPFTGEELPRDQASYDRPLDQGRRLARVAVDGGGDLPAAVCVVDFHLAEADERALLAVAKPHTGDDPVAELSRCTRQCPVPSLLREHDLRHDCPDRRWRRGCITRRIRVCTIA